MRDGIHRFATGDQLRLEFPADLAGLREAGACFLTDAFRASGVLAKDNAVTAITELREVAGGSTGRKAVLSVEYEQHQPGLHTELFREVLARLRQPAPRPG